VTQGKTVQWNLIVLAVGFLHTYAKSRAFTLVILWSGASRPTCKQLDTEAKVSKFLQSSLKNQALFFASSPETPATKDRTATKDARQGQIRELTEELESAPAKN
jgi:hypothetical protein